MTTAGETSGVVVIGGGVGGAAVAGRLARAGRPVTLLERAPEWRWRAGGVFASPATVAELRDLGLDDDMLRRVARPIPAMRVETPGGTAFELTYGADAGGERAAGFDRSALDPLLLDLARAAGAEIRTGVAAREVHLADHRHGTFVRIEPQDGAEHLRARVVIGPDGPRSIVALAAGMTRPPRLRDRVGLSWHVADEAGAGPTAASPTDAGPTAAGSTEGGPTAASPTHAGPTEAGPTAAARRDQPKAARMVVLPDGAYCGLAPVPGGRINVGIVLMGRPWRERLARDGAAATGEHALRSIPPLPGDPEAWREGRVMDHIAGASPLGSRVGRRAGPDWLVVGDAAGFLDPFTGEGLHRALVSARLAAAAVDSCLDGTGSLAAYEHLMRARFQAKDAVSLLVQAFLGRPRMFEHVARRLAAKPRIRATMGLVMGDRVPASRALDPRFLAGLLVP